MSHLLDNGIISNSDSESENENNESIDSDGLIIDNPFFKKTNVVIGDNFKEITNMV